jgi:hypothetical protein
MFQKRVCGDIARVRARTSSVKPRLCLLELNGCGGAGRLRLATVMEAPPEGPVAGVRWQDGVSDKGPVQGKGQYRDRSKARVSAQQYPWGGERARARAGKRRSSTAGARARALKTRPSPRIQAPATPPPPASLRSSNRMRAFFGFWLSKAPSITSSPTPFSRTWSDAHMYSQPGQARASTDCRARRRASAERTGLPQPWRSA